MPQRQARKRAAFGCTSCFVAVSGGRFWSRSKRYLDSRQHPCAIVGIVAIACADFLASSWLARQVQYFRFTRTWGNHIACRLDTSGGFPESDLGLHWSVQAAHACRLAGTALLGNGDQSSRHFGFGTVSARLSLSGRAMQARRSEGKLRINEPVGTGAVKMTQSLGPLCWANFS